MAKIDFYYWGNKTVLTNILKYIQYYLKIMCQTAPCIA